jgi:photosystem II stability/assembly factor-like uncharacterized protein
LLRHNDAYFVTPDTGWIVGYGGVFKTVDGGKSWSQQTIGGKYLRSVDFVNATTGWIGTIDDPFRFFGTHDGGDTWVDVTNRLQGPAPMGICGLWHVDERIVYGVGSFAGSAVLVRTDDGGGTWTTMSMAQHAGSLVDVYFFDELVGIAVWRCPDSVDGF